MLPINTPYSMGFDPLIARTYSSTECESSAPTIQATTAGPISSLFYVNLNYVLFAFSQPTNFKAPKFTSKIADVQLNNIHFKCSEYTNAFK